MGGLVVRAFTRLIRLLANNILFTACIMSRKFKDQTNVGKKLFYLRLIIKLTEHSFIIYSSDHVIHINGKNVQSRAVKEDGANGLIEGD